MWARPTLELRDSRLDILGRPDVVSRSEINRLLRREQEHVFGGVNLGDNYLDLSQQFQDLPSGSSCAHNGSPPASLLHHQRQAYPRYATAARPRGLRLASEAIQVGFQFFRRLLGRFHVPLLSLAASAKCVVLAFVGFSIVGCATPKATKSVQFDPDFNETIVPFHASVVPAGDNSFALYELLRGTLFFYYHDCFDSETRFAGALNVMKELAGDERETGALVVNERSRTFRGEPYERSTAYLYYGICQFNRGNYEAALAAFRNSLASDKETRNENPVYLEDFHVSHFLAAMTYERLGERDNALAMRELARRDNIAVPMLQEGVVEQNFVVIITAGGAPVPVETAILSKGYREQPSPIRRVEILVDGVTKGDAWEATNLFVQANSNQPGAADAAALGRAVGKAVVSGVLSALLGTNVNIEEHRDLRNWSSLPGKFFVFADHVAPGLHHLNLRFYGEDGKQLERFEQIWYEVPVAATADRILLVTSGQNVHNVYGFETLPIREALERRKNRVEQAKAK